MADILIESGVKIAATFLLTLIGVFGAWLTAKLAEKTKLANINASQQEAIDMAMRTVGELQQTVVEGLKAAHEDGKLTKDEIDELGALLLEKTLAKMSQPAVNILAAAAVDIDALIKGAGEDWIRAIK